jgi:hypothetical protein
VSIAGIKSKKHQQRGEGKGRAAGFVVPPPESISPLRKAVEAEKATALKVRK